MVISETPRQPEQLESRHLDEMTNTSTQLGKKRTRIRRATPADARAIGRLFAQEARLQQQLDGYDLVEGYNWAEWAAATLQRPGHIFFVAEHQGIVVAYVYARLKAPPPGLLTLARRWIRDLASRPASGAVFKDWGIIDSLFVAASERRRGVARALVERIQQELAARGVKRIEISVVAGNPEAVAFWTALAYRQFRLHLVRRLEQE